jgi:hypothetical protein
MPLEPFETGWFHWPNPVTERAETGRRVYEASIVSTIGDRTTLAFVRPSRVGAFVPRTRTRSAPIRRARRDAARRVQLAGAEAQRLHAAQHYRRRRGGVGEPFRARLDTPHGMRLPKRSTE